MSWIKRKWSWAKQNPLFGCNILFLAAIVAMLWVWPAPNASDLRVRLLGMVLQLVGIATVWHDLTAAARHFGKGGPLSFFVNTWEWLKAGIIGQKATATCAAFESDDDVFAGRGELRQLIDPSAPLLERVTALEAIVAKIDSHLDSAFRDIDERTKELKTKISTEAAERNGSIGEVKRSIESVATGNYAPLAFGAFWLAVGVVLATLAPEIVLAAVGRWSELWSRI